MVPPDETGDTNRFCTNNRWCPRFTETDERTVWRISEGQLSRTVVPVLIRYFFYNEIALLLELCGFEVEEVYGDFDRIPFEDTVPRMILIAK